MINWNKISSEQALAEVINLSEEKPVLLFKHSNRCSISATALSRLERSWNVSEDKIVPYKIDVIAERPVSNLIAEHFSIRHESPQALVIHKGKCVYDASHLSISYGDILDSIDHRSQAA